MYVHRIRPELDVALKPVELREVSEPRVAVLLNANAKRVNEKTRRALTHVVPERDLFFTRSLDEARAVAETVVDRRYQVVFTGGGDGTFIGFVNEIFNVLERRRSTYPFSAPRPPRFGVLKLGTGNALANLCAASSPQRDGVVDDVLRARAAEVPGVQKVELLMTEGKRAPFAGLGVDAGILNHFVETRRALKRSPLGRVMNGGGGYALAIATRSLPTYLSQSRPELEIRSRGLAYRVGPSGAPVGAPMGPGAILYRGPALMAAASTIPCYGYNLKLFPFAGLRRGLMQLRVANVSIARLLTKIYPDLWNGRFFGDGMHDFLVEDVEIAVDRKTPFQIGGDAEGYRDHVRFTMWKQSLELLDFHDGPRA